MLKKIVRLVSAIIVFAFSIGCKEREANIGNRFQQDDIFEQDIDQLPVPVQAALDGGDLALALRLIQKARSSNPESTSLALAEIHTLIELDHLKEAKERLDELQSRWDRTGGPIRPIDLWRAQMLQANILDASGKTSEAITVLEDLTKKGVGRETPFWGCPYQDLGFLYLKTGRISDGISMMLRAAEVNPESVRQQLVAAWYLFIIGQLEQASLKASVCFTSREDKSLAWAKALHYWAADPYANISPQARFLALRLLAIALDDRYAISEFMNFESERLLGALEVGGSIDPDFNTIVRDAGVSLFKDAWEAIQRHEGISDCDLSDAIVAFNEGRIADADVLTLCILNDDPNSPRALVVAGLVAIIKNDLELADEILHRLERQLLGHLEAELIRGHIHLARRDIRGARNTFLKIDERALAIFHDIDDVRDFAKSHPFDLLVWRMNSLGLAITNAIEGYHHQALLYYQRILDITPEDTQALLGKSRSLAILGNINEAERIINSILAREPGNNQALVALGFIEYNRDNIEKALQLFEQALLEDSYNYACPHEGLGLVYMRQGRFSEAEKELEKAASLDPEREHIKFIALAKIRIKQGRLHEARNLLLRSLELTPNNSEALMLLHSLSP